MQPNSPLVTIGIPTYNRADLLKRSILSAINQNYSNVEIIVSDNASTDHTAKICLELCEKDNRIKYFAQLENLGPVKNFSIVLKHAQGQYFMWLGDDDWIDPDYVSVCLSILLTSSDYTLISGYPQYYKNGVKAYSGRLFNVLNNFWAYRVAKYYWMVSDNGMFYGLMPTLLLKGVPNERVMGGDWHLISNIVAAGKAMMVSDVSVHRELGGATASYQQIAKSLGLSSLSASFPMTVTAVNGVKNVLMSGTVFQKKNMVIRILLAGAIFSFIISRPFIRYLKLLKRFFESFPGFSVRFKKQ